MPNQPKTPHHSVRIPESIWDDAQAIAALRGENLSEHVLRPAVVRYVRRHRSILDTTRTTPKE